MEEKKDYSLLRPFDLEAAKRGEMLCDTDGDLVTYISGPSAKGEFCIDLGSLGFCLCNDNDLRMAPLAWVEGKPVYKGDVLYLNGEEYLTCDGSDEVAYSTTHAKKHGPRPAPSWDQLTWTPPKTKRTVKLLAFISDNKLCWYVDNTVTPWGGLRVPSKDETVEVEG